MVSAAVRATEDLRQTPVHDEDLAIVADHDVGGLEVAVHDAAGMGKGHAVADLEEDLEEIGKREERGTPF
jgi:hypothetical protein